MCGHQIAQRRVKLGSLENDDAQLQPALQGHEGQETDLIGRTQKGDVFVEKERIVRTGIRPRAAGDLMSRLFVVHRQACHHGNATTSMPQNFRVLARAGATGRFVMIVILEPFLTEKQI